MSSQLNPTIAKFLGRFATFCSCLSVGFGLFVLTGWTLHIQTIKTVLPGQVPVKANAAICFLLIGLALWFVREEESRPRGWRLAGQCLAVLAAVIGILSFLEYWCGWNLGVDQLLFTAGPQDLAGSVRPGLMSPIAAAGFCLLGLTIPLLSLRARWCRALEHGLACIAAATCIFGILDFVLDPASTRTHIAPNTALVLFLFSFGVMLSRTDWGLGRLLASPTSGGQLARVLLPAAIVVPIGIAWLHWRGQTLGLYSEWTGLALMTVACALLLAGLTAWTALMADRSDTRRGAAEQSLRRLASIVSSSNDAIITKNLDGIVTDWNPGAESVYGYSAHEMIGSPIATVFPPHRLGDSHLIMQKIAAGQQLRYYETEHRRKDGQIIPVSLSASPVRDEVGRVIGAATITRDMSEAKRAEAALRRSETRYRSLVTATTQIVWTTDPQGEVVDDMPMWRAFTGMTLAEIQGWGWISSLHADDRPRTAEIWTKAVAERGLYNTEYRIRRHDGEHRHVAVRGVPVLDNDGNIQEWVGTCTDITDRKQAEEKLREASLYARSLIEASPDPLVMISRDGKITDVNQATEKATGVTRERIIGSDFSNYFTEPDRARTGYKRVFSQGFVQDYPLSLRHVSGKAMDVLYNAALYRNTSGEVEGVFAAARDVTERKQAEEKAREASLYARNLIEASMDPLVTISKDGKIADVNEATERATGIGREELIGTDFSSYFTDSEKARQGYQRVFAQGYVRDYPLSIRHSSGVVMDVLYNATVFKNEQGEVDGVFAAARDITDRKRAEEALNRSEIRYRSLVTATAQVVWMTDPQGQVADMPMWRAITGQTIEEVRGAGWLNAVHPKDRDRTAMLWARAVKDRSLYDVEYRVRRNDGEYRHFAVRGVPVLGDDGAIREWIGTCTDITERKQAEEEVRRLNAELEQRVIQRTAQLEAANKELEAFTYSVSHNLRAPLRHISGFSKILTEGYASSLPPDAQHHLQRIEDGTRRMGLLVDDLLNLARVGRRDLSLQVTGLRSVVDDVIESLKPDLANRQLEWKIGDLPFVGCDAALMKQVFQNLLSNAVKFTRPRARAVIEIGQTEQNGTPVIFVRDNGVGFSMKYADKLFGVFQRLHRAEDFEGTGVGLATIQRIVQKHSGRIWAEAELDKGATFYFTLATSEKSEVKAEAMAAGEKL
jgi:PAS domain S-box-containing protein